MRGRKKLKVRFYGKKGKIPILGEFNVLHKKLGTKNPFTIYARHGIFTIESILELHEPFEVVYMRLLSLDLPLISVNCELL